MPIKLLIRERRHDRQISQEELARRIKRSVFTISRWERGIGSPPADTMYDIAEALGCRVTDLIDENGIA